MEFAKNITVIIPVHKLEKGEEKMLKEAFQSIKDSTVKPELVVFVVTPESFKKVGTVIKNSEYDGYVKVVHNETTCSSYQAMVNLGASAVETSHFMVLEFDDKVYGKNVFKRAEAYFEAYPDAKMFLPFVLDFTEGKDGNAEAAKMSNEVLWVKDINEEIGTLTHESLKNYSDYQTAGAFINTAAFKAAGGLKNHIEHTFMYEFLLRFSQKHTIVSIPFITYVHRNMRAGSISEASMNISNEVLDFWMEAALKEYHFTDDRTVENNA